MLTGYCQSSQTGGVKVLFWINFLPPSKTTLPMLSMAAMKDSQHYGNYVGNISLKAR